MGKQYNLAPQVAALHQQLENLQGALTGMTRLPVYRLLRALGFSRGAGATGDQLV